MIFIAPDFWSAARCEHVRRAIDRGQLSRAEIFVGTYHVDEDVRRTFEVDLDPQIVEEVERSIDDARPRVAEFFGTPLVGSEGPGFLRYPAGGFYRAHRDCLPDSADAFPRRIALVLFVTANCEGGALRIYDEPVRDIEPVIGTLVAFPATCLHEVLPVTAGLRDTVVDWFH